MKRKLLFSSIATLLLLLGAILTTNIVLEHNQTDFLASNLEALVEGEVSITVCLSIWGECTMPDGTKTPGPAINAQF